MSSYNTIVSDILAEIDNILGDFVFQGYQGLVDYLEIPLASAIVLFFVCYGISISQGWIKGSVSGLTHSLFKIGIIYYLGMNWSHFSMYVYDLFYTVSSEIGSALLNSLNFNFSYDNESGINAGLQMVLSEIWKVAQEIFNNGGITNPGPWLGGILVGLIGLFFIGISLLEVIIAKCMISILLVTAPLFIAFTLFEITETFFDRWLGACMSYASLMIFISSALGVVISLDHWILNDYVVSISEKMTWIDTATAILVTWVCIGIIKRISVLAMSIGGSVSTISANEMFAGTIGTLLNPSKETNGSSKSRGNTHSNHRGQSQQSNKAGSENSSSSSSSAINPMVNDRGRFVDGSSHYGSHGNASESAGWNRTDKHSNAVRYRSDNTPKIITQKIHSDSVYQKKNKNALSDYD